MDSQLIFSKTPRGSEEISTRSGGLSLQVRRVLIMVDGKRTVTELAQFARAGEILDVLSQLETAGFISRPAPPAVAPPPPPAAGPATVGGPATGRGPATVRGPMTIRPRPRTLSSAVTEGGEPQRVVITLEEAKRRAVRELLDRVGPAGDDMARRIERCDTPETFRDRVRDAERLVAGFSGEAAALEYLRALRGR
jgi:hypothetical protein